MLSVGSSTPVLQNATASFSQSGFLVSSAIDGVTTGPDGWANNSQGDNVAVFETVTDITNAGKLQFTVHSGSFDVPIGRFRILVTNDDRDDFADGLSSGGDVTANWTVLDPLSFFSNDPGISLTELGDNSLLASGATTLGSNPEVIYTILTDVPIDNITGIRLEAITDLSLPGTNNGPGLSGNGNYVIREFELQVIPPTVPEPSTFILAGLGMIGLGLCGRRRNRGGASASPVVAQKGRTMKNRSTSFAAAVVGIAALLGGISSAQAVVIFSDNFDNIAGGDGPATGNFAMPWAVEGTKFGGAGVTTVTAATPPSGTQVAFFQTDTVLTDGINIDTGVAANATSTYTLSYFTLGQTGAILYTGTARAELWAGDPSGGGTLIGFGVATNPAVGATALNTHVIPGIAATGNVYVRYLFGVGGSSFQQGAIDSVSLDAVVPPTAPEPSTFLLAGLSLVALSVRRRRRTRS